MYVVDIVGLVHVYGAMALFFLLKNAIVLKRLSFGCVGVLQPLLLSAEICSAWERHQSSLLVYLSEPIYSVDITCAGAKLDAKAASQTVASGT